MIDLLATHKVILYESVIDGGYLNHDNEWIQAPFNTPVELWCSLIPFNQGKHKIVLPDGVRTDQAMFLRCRKELKVGEQSTNTRADEIEYNGYRYEVFYQEPYVGYGLPTDHYKYLLKRKDNR